jgi:hypothetical protein
VLTAINALVFWIFWDEMNKRPAWAVATPETWDAHTIAFLLLFTSALPALLSVGAVAYAQYRTRVLTFWEQVLPGLASIGHLVAFYFLSDKALDSLSDASWILGDSYGFVQFAAMTPGALCALWCIACIPSKLSAVKDCMFSLATAAGVPGAFYFIVIVFIPTGNQLGVGIWQAVYTFVFIVFPAVFFVAWLRGLSWVGNYVWRNGSRWPTLRILFTLLISLVLPLGGLLLNAEIPFPADFQSIWPYALLILNAVALTIPNSGQHTVHDSALRALRWILFPFTLYFFAVFLPFLPFAICAIVILGGGCLILAPVLLFVLHLQALRRDVKEAKAAAPGKRLRLCLLAAAALAVLPLGFAAEVEFDRHALHQMLAHQYSSTYTADVVSPVTQWRAERVLRQVEDFKKGTQIPYLTNWYNWRVFDNLLLSNVRFNELWHTFVDDNPPKTRYSWGNNLYAELFNTRAGSRSRSRLVMGVRPHTTTTIDHVNVVSSSAGAETETHVTLSVSSSAREETEFTADIVVPPGVWVSGLKLKIGKEWVDGKIIERKAAEWVYREITTRFKDPAILRYEDEGRLSIRVFPVPPKGSREVRLSFLFPTGFADAVRIGERTVDISGGVPVKPLIVRSGGVLASNGKHLLKPVPLQTETCAIVDFSSGQNWTPEGLSAALLSAATPDAPVRTVILANYETRTFESADDGGKSISVPDAKTWLQERGGFDANNALLRAVGIYFSPERLNGAPEKWRNLRLTILRNKQPVEAPQTQDEQARKKVQPLSWVPVLRPETNEVLHYQWPSLEDIRVLNSKTKKEAYIALGARTTQESAPLPPSVVPVRAGKEIRWLAAAAPSLCIFTGEDVSAAPLQFWDAGSGAFSASPEIVEFPAQSHWALGAEAWQLQRRQSLHSQKDLRRPILEASRASGVLTSAGSYIVVENSAQWKMLELAQKQTLSANKGFDLQEAPAPDAWILALCFALFLGLWALIRRHVRKGLANG